LGSRDPFGLTADEIGAINLYTQEWHPSSNSLYSILNGRLRAEDRKSIHPFRSYLKLLLTALEKLPKKELTVWRGVKRELYQVYPKGKVYYWWSFSSCTENVEVLENPSFLGKEGKRTLFTVSTSAGVSIKPYSMYPEDEILLPPGMRFKVTGILDQKELHIIQLKECIERGVS